MAPAPVFLLVDRPGAAQSNVAIGRIGPARDDPRYVAFEVLRAVLGGSITSRLRHRLSEELGITYDVRTGMAWRQARGPLAIETAIVTDQTATGIAETLKIVDDLSTTAVPPTELDLVRHNLVRTLPTRFATADKTAAAFADLALHGLPDDWYAQFAAAIGRVTATDVRAAAQALLSSASLAIAIVGDLAKIRPALAKLGLGAATAYDLDATPLSGR